MNRIYTNLIIKQPDKHDSFEKGRLFEEYITTLFNEKNFQLKEWRKSENFPGSFIPHHHSYPDLELVFMGRKNHHFAIECKWQNRFTNGTIRWAKEYKIRIYKKFQAETGMPVFIAIGIGGEPSAPEKLFVTPLDNICTCPDVSESDLIPYKRKPTSKFFYDTIQLRLW